MTPKAAAPSLVSQVRPVEAGGFVVGAAFLGDMATFATGEGEVVLFVGEVKRVKAHEGGILAAAGGGGMLFTAGDDGRVKRTNAAGDTEEIANANGKWIDHLTLGPGGAVAWSAGKTAFVRTDKGERSLDLPSSVGGLAFAPKGVRLAIAHYNGATLWFSNTDAKPETLEWKGSHHDVLFSPDGRFLITAMLEPALHGWRLADGKHMRMSGYPGRVRSMSFLAGGEWLATSGAQEVILWPFRDRDGPMGKPPRMAAPQPKDARVSVVACHPKQPVLAAGYSDGSVRLVRLADGAVVLVEDASGSPASALGWRGDGQALAFGSEAGKAGILMF